MPMGAPPQPTSDTWRPVRPSLRYCIALSPFLSRVSGELGDDDLVVFDAGHVHYERVALGTPTGVTIGDEHANSGGAAAGGQADVEALRANGQDFVTGAMPDIRVAQVDEMHLDIVGALVGVDVDQARAGNAHDLAVMGGPAHGVGEEAGEVGGVGVPDDAVDGG